MPHRVLDIVKVKGKKNAVELIHLLERDYSAEGLQLFQEGRALYRSQNWIEASAKFELANQLLALSPEVPDGPSQIYIERCLIFQTTPPETDWDGSWEMDSK